MASRIRITHNEPAHIRCARALTLAGAADPDHWLRAKRDAHKYLQRTLEAWIDEGYGDLPRVTTLDAGLVHGLAEVYGHSESAEEPACYHVIVAANSYIPVHLDAAMRVLEAADPRFPVTFHELLLSAMSSVSEVYCWHDALGDEWSAQLLLHLSRPEAERADEYVIEIEELDWKELDELAKAVLPAYLHRKPYSVRQLRDRLCRTTQPAALRLFTDLLAILNETRLMRWREDWREAWESLQEIQDDLMAPWPAFFLGFTANDHLAGVFEQECFDRDNYGMEAAPCLVFRIDVTDLDSVRRARELLVRACRILGMIKQLVDTLPAVADPRALVNIVVHG
ncbi:MAG: hypothetical protein ACRENP_12225 [Longimicrobiales bacterium]